MNERGESVAERAKRRKNSRKTALRFTTGLLLAVILFTGLLFVWGRKRGHGRVTFSAEQFTESSRYLSNPNRGFYYIYGFVITDETTRWSETVEERFREDTGTNLTMIQINLCNYRDRELTEQGLCSLRNLFQALRGTGKQLIVRFLYDWSGENTETEPEDISVILRHMEQVGSVVTENRDIIFTLQGLFTGNWGEMNGTRYSTAEDWRKLYETIRTATGDSVFLAVRMPMQWRNATGFAEIKDAFQDGCRLGLFNDGIMGNYSDYGTYGEVSRREAGDFSCWRREEELAFQEELCGYVPNGGEVIVDNPYNDWEAAMRNLAVMHISYLNADYDREVLEKWAAAMAEGDCYHGMDGLSYAERHLGYRLLLKEVNGEYHFRKDVLSLRIGLQNVGFAPVLKEVTAEIMAVREDIGECRKIPLNVDFTCLTGGRKAEWVETVSADIPLTGWKSGTCRLYLCFTDKDSGRQILFANTQNPTEYGYFLGTVEMESLKSR